ncbi:MAG: trigger factor [Candidatus Omnitrophica bacterium]|nr:trigger factor [Candidatus Omnitrophota bacterium]MDD5652796.1 trigger factor [Candidatus Omnitrophota bacterium]
MKKSEVKKIDATKREITVEVSGEVVKNKFEEAFKKISETAKVPGFRPGHAPRDMIEKNFAHHVNEEVLRGLIPDVYQEVVKTEGLDVIDMPEISDVKLERELLSFKATVEVSPEFDLPKYKGIKVDYKKIEVTADELKRHLDSLKESRKLDSLSDSFARSLGYPSLAELEEAIKRQIFLQKENQQRQKIENEVVEAVTKELDFKIPQVMIDRQLEDLVRQSKVNLALKGMPREKIDEQEKEIAKELGPQAKSQVKIYLVLSAIAKKENISQDEHMPQHVLEFLLKEANWS